VSSGGEQVIRVLFVDDEDSLLELGRLFLERPGDFTVTTTPRASDAIELLRREKFDAIISDYQMPGMDGIAFLKHLRAGGDTTPFIIFTGKGRENVVIEALNAGADFYLQKGGEAKSQFAEMAHTIRHTVSLRQTAIALRESERKYRTLIETLQEGVWVTDTDGKTVFANPRMAEMLGYTAGEMQKRAFLDFIDEEQRTIIREWFEHVRAGAREQYESALISRDGTRINVLIATSPVYDEKGTYSGAIAAIADITRTKKRQLEYRNMVQQNTEAMLILDTGFSIVYANPAAGTIFGSSSEKLAGAPFGYPVISGELTEITIPRRDGTVSVGEIRVSDISWEDKPAHMVIIRDITEKKKMSAQIEASLAEKETLLKEIHHRVKNNLQIITSMLGMQIRKTDNPRTIEALQDGQNRVRSMALVHEHLYTSKDLAKIDLRKYIAALEMEIFQSYEATKQGIRFENGIRDIYVDINLSIPLGLITNELITNSLKYAFNDRNDGKISITASEDRQALTYVVADNGTGIPEGITLENQTSLGLRLVNILVRQLHGSVTIDRTVGTKFVFIIPKTTESPAMV
jgi:PAS domain S-box-containing protein